MSSDVWRLQVGPLEVMAAGEAPTITPLWADGQIPWVKHPLGRWALVWMHRVVAPVRILSVATVLAAEPCLGTVPPPAPAWQGPSAMLACKHSKGQHDETCRTLPRHTYLKGPH